MERLESLREAMSQRHSVRAYQARPIEDGKKEKLKSRISQCNRESGLHIQLVTDEPKAFDSRMAHYGKFSGVTNYLALVGKKGAKLEELCGYYGEQLVLYAQQMELNTCWVALTYKKIPEAFQVDPGEKLAIVIAIGYGKNPGVPHRSKAYSAVCAETGAEPDWFRDGVEAALLAPTAVNQQKFHFTYKEGKVAAKAGWGFYSRIDLGIVKYHFEIGAGRDRGIWC